MQLRCFETIYFKTTLQQLTLIRSDSRVLSKVPGAKLAMGNQRTQSKVTTLMRCLRPGLLIASDIGVLPERHWVNFCWREGKAEPFTQLSHYDCKILVPTEWKESKSELITQWLACSTTIAELELCFSCHIGNSRATFGAQWLKRRTINLRIIHHFSSVSLHVKRFCGAPIIDFRCHIGDSRATSVCCPFPANPCAMPRADGTGSARLPRW